MKNTFLLPIVFASGLCCLPTLAAGASDVSAAMISACGNDHGMGMVSEMAGISDPNYKLNPGVLASMSPAGAKYLSCIVAEHNRFLSSSQASNAKKPAPEAKPAAVKADQCGFNGVSPGEFKSCCKIHQGKFSTRLRKDGTYILGCASRKLGAFNMSGVYRTGSDKQISGSMM